MSLDITALIQSAFMLCLGVFFSAVAIDRQTLVTSLLAAVIWIVEGIINWLFAPSSYIGQAMSYIFWVIGVVFIGMFFYKMATMWYDLKNKRFETGPI
jgi:hypothetical protein